MYQNIILGIYSEGMSPFPWGLQLNWFLYFFSNFNKTKPHSIKPR